MFDSFFQSLLVVAVFGGLIFFHELGHFLGARLFSIGVKTFSLGFGPVLVARTFGKTRCQIAAIPLGGYVALVGETPDADIPEPFTQEESFALRPAWQRFVVIVAGPVFNLALAWFLCWGLLFAMGKVELPPVVGSVRAEAPAALAGLAPGDRIMKINETTITRWEQIPQFMQANQSAPIAVTFERQGLGTSTVEIAPAQMEQTLPSGEKVSSWVLGITSGTPIHTPLGFMEAGAAGIEKAGHMLRLTWDGLKGLITRSIPASSMGGPIGIAQIIYKQAEHGAADVILLAALISVNLGMLNLLPIPVLDGGHLMFLSFEMITGKAVPLLVQHKATMAGLALLLCLMLFATFNDILRIFS